VQILRTTLLATADRLTPIIGANQCPKTIAPRHDRGNPNHTHHADFLAVPIVGTDCLRVCISPTDY